MGDAMTLVGQGRSYCSWRKYDAHPTVLCRGLRRGLHVQGAAHVQGLALSDAMKLVGQGGSVVAPGVFHSDKRS